jgi:hypothetical protein
LPTSRRRRGRAATRAARSGNMISTNRRKKTNKLYIAASVIIAVLVIASFALTSMMNNGGGNDSENTDGYVEGVGTQVEIINGWTHVDEGVSVTYTTAPPASGDHWESPAQCRFYEEVLPDERVVHNMEHGHIVVSYNLPLASDVSDLRDALDSIGLNQTWGLARSYPGIPEGQVALSTWGVIDTFAGVDRDRINTFFETYAGNLGPEYVPC